VNGGISLLRERFGSAAVSEVPPYSLVTPRARGCHLPVAGTFGERAEFGTARHYSLQINLPVPANVRQYS